MQSNNFFNKLKCFFFGHIWSYNDPKDFPSHLRRCTRCEKADNGFALFYPKMPRLKLAHFEDSKYATSKIELEVGEDDVLIMSSPDPISRDVAEHIQAVWDNLIEQKKKVFLVEGNFHFTVIKGIRKKTTEKKD